MIRLRQLLANCLPEATANRDHRTRFGAGWNLRSSPHTSFSGHRHVWLQATTRHATHVAATKTGVNVFVGYQLLAGYSEMSLLKKRISPRMRWQKSPPRTYGAATHGVAHGGLQPSRP